nr:MAG TPA: hypothetical protein [Caudoviricetes sp.]
MFLSHLYRYQSFIYLLSFISISNYNTYLLKSKQLFIIKCSIFDINVIKL